MDRLAAGTVIAVAVFAANGALVRDVQAEDGQRHALSTSLSSATSVDHGLRSERVLSLLLTLEALQAAPQVLGLERS